MSDDTTRDAGSEQDPSTHSADAGPHDADSSDGGDGAPKKKRRRRRRRKSGGEGGGTPESNGQASAQTDQAGDAGAASDGPGDPGEPGSAPSPTQKRRRRRRRSGNEEGAGSGSGGSRSGGGGGGGGGGDGLGGNKFAKLLDERPEEHDDTPVEFDDDNVEGLGEAFDLETSFTGLGLRNSLLRGIQDAGFRRPTKIQSQLIKPLLEGRDMFGQAKTGTGKTAAFALPILNAVEPGVPFQALILVPTRELAIQCANEINLFGMHTPARALPVYGGQRIHVQAELLEKAPEIVVATPGRVMDMVGRGHFHYHNVKMVCLDEVDRMLDIGFREDIKRILPACPKDRQTVFVSATMSEEIERLARRFCKDNIEKIVTSSGALTVDLVTQHFLSVEPWDKPRLLVHLLKHEDPALTIVFCRMKRTVDKLAKLLADKGLDAHAIHGDFHQSKRNRVIEQLKKGNLNVLIASDLASRGLDVDGITHVINYDLPEDPDLYVHRIGRTARAGRDGIAWSLVTPAQGPLLTEIEVLINAEIPALDYPGFKPGPVPEDVRVERERDAQRPPTQKNRFAAPDTEDIPPVETVDMSKFPDGIVPSKLPPKRMGGRVRTRGR